MVKTLTLLFSLACALTANAASDKYIAAAAHAAGANNTFFQTDVRIVNLSAATATVNVIWLPSNVDNSSPLTVAVSVPARSSRQLDDIVLSKFGVASGGGAIRLTSESDFVATSRTYTSSASGCPGTFGQFIPATDKTQAATRMIIPAVMLSATASSGFRTNVGAVNTTASPASLDLALRDGSGGVIGRSTLQLPANGHNQQSVAALFNQQNFTGNNLFLEIQSTQPVLSYISVVDNASADPIFVPASVDTGTPAAGAQSIVAKQWGFEPATIDAEVGKKVTLTFRSVDVDHGVSFSGVGAVNCSSEQAGQCILRPNEDVTVTFTPTSRGSFAFFCTRFCGASADSSSGHATMRGTIVVK